MKLAWMDTVYLNFITKLGYYYDYQFKCYSWVEICFYLSTFVLYLTMVSAVVNVQGNYVHEYYNGWSDWS